MLFFVRTIKGSAIYARLKNKTGQYWDFTAVQWVNTENANCKISLTEYADSDTLESLYMAEVSAPPGGPWIEEAVQVSNGEVIAFDDKVMGELEAVPDLNSSLQERLAFIFQYLAGKRTATSTLETMHKMDNTVLATATLSDDGATFTKNKVV